MGDPLVAPTPKAKLAQSRADLLAAMGLEPTERSIADPAIELPRWTPGHPRPTAGAMRRWWPRHPARSAIELLEPGLARYARRNPHRLVGYAAGAVLAYLENARAASRSATTQAREPRPFHGPARAAEVHPNTESIARTTHAALPSR